ncbi:MAG: TetR family transcriptional regulator [Clostridia bacterium]|nr:TetR family transcriptional regulator [Clostridia bacterium]
MANSQIMKEAIGAKTKELLGQQTIEKITVSHICEKTGIDRKTFYRYFKDKYEVVEWIYHHDYYEKIGATDDWNMWDYFTETAKRVYAERDWFLNAFLFQGQNSFRDYFVDLYMPIAMNEYRHCFASEEMARFFISNTLNFAFDAFEKWFRSSPLPSFEEFNKEFKTGCQNFYSLTSEYARESLERDDNS